MLSNYLLLSFLIPLFISSNTPYDTSTPEKFVIAMGLISQHPKTENPLPYFYEKDFALALTKFDESGKKAQLAFDQFRNAIAEKFPNNTLTNEEGNLKIALDGFSKMKIRTFSYRANLIGEQLKERSPSDYEFVSATEPDENNISQLTLKILGNEKTLPIIKTEEGYKMYLPKDVLNVVNTTTNKGIQLESVFSKATQSIEKGKVTTENFEAKLEKVIEQYEKALN